MYRSTLSLTSALDGSGWSTPRPGRCTPGKTRYPLYGRLGGPQDRSGRVRKISPPPGFDPPIVHPVGSRYTDWAIPTQLVRRNLHKGRTRKLILQIFMSSTWNRKCVETPRYKPGGRGFDYRMALLDLFISIIFPSSLLLSTQPLTDMSARCISWG